MYEAMANACLRLQHDLSPSRFNKALPANHAVADVASRLWNILPPSNMESLQQQIDEISTSIEGKKEPATSENNLRTLMAMEERLDKARRNVATLLVDVQDSMPAQAKGLINSEDLTTMQTLAGSQLISFA